MSDVGSIASRVRRLIGAAAPTARAADDVTDDQRLVDDLEFDSLRLMELTVALERAFDLPRFRPEELAGVRSVGDVITLISSTSAVRGSHERA